MGTHPIFESDFDCLTEMGKVSRKKQKLTKAAKSAKLDGGDAEIKVENGPKKLIDEALQYFKNGDAQSAKKLARRVIKICDDPELLNDCGAILSEVGEETMAQEALRRSVTLDPDHSYEKYITLGQLTSGAESLKYLTKGIELLKTEEKNEIRKLSKAYCNIAELYMTDLCMEKDAQQKCHEAVELAVSSDKSNPEAFHIAASYLISSSKFDEAKVELKRGLDLWIADHESAEVENEESLLEELQKEKLDPEIRMSALRLTVELEMWDESITIARQLSEENVENCEPRYFLAFSLFRLLSATPEGEEKENLKVDCNEAAQDTKRLAEKAWKEKRGRTAKDILEQTNELIEDLGPVEFRPAMNDEDEWESEEEEMDQN